MPKKQTGDGVESVNRTRDRWIKEERARMRKQSGGPKASAYKHRKHRDMKGNKYAFNKQRQDQYARMMHSRTFQALPFNKHKHQPKSKSSGMQYAAPLKLPGKDMYW